MNCKVESCQSAATRKGAQLCEAHYMRFYRTGTFEKKARSTTAIHSSGYVIEYRKGHPLCTIKGRNAVFQHRMVFYDAHGSGPFNCHWCKAVVTWDDLHIDHLNENRKDNAIKNLAASCAICNQQRGMWKSIAKAKHAGRVITFNGESYCQIDWARKVGISSAALQFRLKHNWPLEIALTKKRGVRGPQMQAGSISHKLLHSQTAFPMELNENTLEVLGLEAMPT